MMVLSLIGAFLEYQETQIVARNKLKTNILLAAQKR